MTSPREYPKRGFTIIELMVTVALLTLMVIGVSQVVSSTASLTEAASQTMDDGTVSPDPPASLATEGPSGVQSIVVAIAVLDSKARLIVSDLGAVASALPYPDPGAADLLPAAVWNPLIEGGTLPMPQGAPSQVRVYQRAFPISHAF